MLNKLIGNGVISKSMGKVKDKQFWEVQDS